MKNIFKKIFFSVLVTCLFISCSDFSNSDSSFVTNEKGRIIISTNLDSQSRSVLPTGITEQTQGLTWELVGTCEEKTYSERWNDTTSEDGSVTSTAYNNMKNDNDLLLDVGTWLFSLKVKNNNGYVLVGTTQVAINSGENTLSFVMNEATSDDLSDGETVASGSIEFTLKFPKDVIDNVVATLYNHENNEKVESATNFSIDPTTTDNYSSVKYSYQDSTGATSTLAPGYYRLHIKLRQNTGDATASNYQTINTYTCLVRVAPGLCSKGEYTLNSLAKLYTITYECNQGTFGTEPITTSYNEYTSFELPEPTYQGHCFAGWYTDSELTIPVELDENGKYRIKQDTTLYAKWNKEVTGITHADKTLYISDYEGLCIFRNIVNGSHPDAITIPAKESISGASAFVCDAGTSYNYLSVELEKDIEVTDDWILIGVYSSTPSESRDYIATFDGNNHTITLSNGIVSTSYAALFVNVAGTIKNLVVGGNIESEGSNAVAGICAYSNGGTFEHCVNKCKINSNTSSGTGGIVGYSNGATIKSCVNMVEISSLLSTIGGIVGAANPSSDITIENSINLGKITGTSNVSGIFGLGGSSASEQNITDCINIGEIAVTPSDGDYWTYAAGIICSSDSVTVSNCISVGNIINNTSDFQGTAKFGAINYSSDNGTYSNCYYDSSKINSPNDSNALGIYSEITSVLCNLDYSILSNWSRDPPLSSRYPLPNIVATDSSEGISESVWSEICELAKVDYSSSGSSGIVTSANVSTFSELKEQIESVIDTIYTLENPYVIGITSSFDIGTDITATTNVKSHIKLVAINPDGCTITKNDSLAAVNIFTVEAGASLTLGDSNAVGELIIDGNETLTTTTKSLISVTGTLVLNEKSTLQNNKCKEGYATNGAAVYSNKGTVKILGGTVKNNSNSYNDNTGGAIYIKNGTFEMTAGVVSNNSSYSSGGAIYVESSTVTISGGTFENNKASIASGNLVYGGALFLSSCTVNITGGTFSNNIATNTGTTTTNTDFYGGAIYIIHSGTSNDPARIFNCTFSSNSADQRGGAIYTGGTSYIDIASCSFKNNTVTNGDAQGSAVYIGNSDGNIDISYCVFSSNTASDTIFTVYNDSTGGTHLVDDIELLKGNGYNPN